MYPNFWERRSSDAPVKPIIHLSNINITHFDVFMFMTRTVEPSGKFYIKILCSNLSRDADMYIVTSVCVCVNTINLVT